MKGKAIGSLKRLQKRFAKLELAKPLYIGCQQHVLNAILKHVTRDFFDGATISPKPCSNQYLCLGCLVA